MGKNPTFPFYASDFLTDTNDWTPEEVGAFIRLLCTQWVNGGLTGDLNRLARVAGMGYSEFLKAWEVVGKKFKKNADGNFFNERLEFTRQEKQSFLKSQSRKGELSAQKRWGNRGYNSVNNQTGNQNITQEEEKEIEEEIVIEEEKEDETPVKKIEPWPTFQDFWEEYDKKVGKKEKVAKKWQALKHEEKVKIMDYLPGYKAATPDKTFRKNPETFLNNQAWNDELIIKENGQNTKGEQYHRSGTRYNELFKKYMP